MTERWRKRLGDLDKQSPTEDLFERAKGGPQLPDDPISRPSTSTRIVTGVAAFLVFALAISVFAIPALRLKGGTGAGSFGPTVQPLWPWRTVDEAKAWQERPAAIGGTPSSDFSSADAAAAAFGREVLGWGPEVYSHERGVPQTFPCNEYFSQAPSDNSDQCSLIFGGGSVGPTVGPYAPTTSAPAFRTFDLTTCPPSAACDYVPPGPGSASVVVYQPLGEGGPWAILEAATGSVRLSVSPGATIVEGSSLAASGAIPAGYEANIGLQIGSPTDGSGCDVSLSDSFNLGSQVVNGPLNIVQASLGSISLTDAAGRCTGAETGYVFAVVAEDRATASIDPLRGSDRPVYEFTAVPVIVEFPQSETPSVTSTPPVSSSAIEWTTHTDALGWTIDVPTTWVTLPIDGSDASRTYEGAAFGSAQPQQEPAGPTALGAAPGEVTVILSHAEGGQTAAPADDSLFPLSIDDFAAQEGGVAGPFEAGGLRFDLSIRYSDLTAEQSAIIRRMVSSISFPTWHVGDTRNGWTAVGKVLLASSAEWLTFQGDHYVATYGQRRTLLGPAPACAGGGGSYEVRETGVAGVSCPDGTGGDWVFATGDAQPSNTTGFDVPLASYPAVRTGDGMLVVQFPQGQS